MHRRLLETASSWLRGLCGKRQSETSTDKSESSSLTTESSLPPSPRILLANRTIYEVPLLNRRVDDKSDAPLKALYRIYEHLILDQHLELRNEIEAFWYHNDWQVAAIPDPHDPDAERYACLACIPSLLCLAFNKRIELGLPRDAPAIFTQDMLAKWREQERQYEQTPPWTERVPSLAEELAIPHWDNDQRDFVALKSMNDDKRSKEFALKNILVWQPHIHFA